MPDERYALSGLSQTLTHCIHKVSSSNLHRAGEPKSVVQNTSQTSELDHFSQLWQRIPAASVIHQRNVHSMRTFAADGNLRSLQREPVHRGGRGGRRGKCGHSVGEARSCQDDNPYMQSTKAGMKQSTLGVGQRTTGTTL